MNILKYRFFSELLLLCAILVITGCSVFNSEVDNIDVVPSPKVKNKLSLIKRWTVNIGGDAGVYSLLAPTGDSRIAYLASRSGQVKAVSIDTGKILWRTDLGNSSLFSRAPTVLLSGGLTIYGKNVYVGSERAVVYALDRSTGDLTWQQDVAGEVLVKPVIVDNIILLHTSNGFLQALNSETGAVLWQYRLDVPPLSLRGSSIPAVVGDVIIVGDDNGHVNAISLRDGLLIWQQRISQPKGSTEIARLNDVDASPLVKGNVVYASGYNGQMAGLDLYSGQLLWSQDIGSAYNFIIKDDVIYVVDQNDAIKSLELNGGKLLWQKNDLKNRRLTDMVLYQGYLVVGDSEGYLYLLDSKTADFVYKLKISSDGLLSAPIVMDEQLLIQTRSGVVYAFVLSER